MTDQDWQSDFSLRRRRASPRPAPWNRGNAQARVHRRATACIEVRGLRRSRAAAPVFADRLWVWGSYGVQEIDLLHHRPTSPDATGARELRRQAQRPARASNELVGFYPLRREDQDRPRRRPAAPRAHDLSTRAAPTTIYKLEDTHLVQLQLLPDRHGFVRRRRLPARPPGRRRGRPQLPERRPAAQPRVAEQLPAPSATERPQEQAKLEGSYFFNAGTTSHELRFGAGYRQADDRLVFALARPSSSSACADLRPRGGRLRRLRHRSGAQPPLPRNEYHERVRAGHPDLVGNLTANVGLRYDRQRGSEPGRRPSPRRRSTRRRAAGRPLRRQATRASSGSRSPRASA